MAQLRRGQFRRQQAAGGVVPAALSRRAVRPPERGPERCSISAPRASPTWPGLLAMPIFNAGRTRAINEIAESGQHEALLRYEDGIVRALEDVENALVALRDERSARRSLQSAAASAEAALGPRAIAVRPRADRSVAAARCAAHAPERARERERQQHATAARQRAALQGAGRRLAGVRASRHAQPAAADATATIPETLSSTKEEPS